MSTAVWSDIGKHPQSSITIMAHALNGRDYLVDETANFDHNVLVKAGVTTNGQINSGPANDTIVNNGAGSINLVLAANDGHDTWTNFHTNLDHITIQGFTQNQVTVQNQSAGDLVSFDSTSVLLVGIHDSYAQLLNDGVFIFA
jgi:hypothetical protein